MNIQTLKGFRDFLPKEAKKREYVINTLKKVFELYGFEPLETPSLEYEEILTGKYGEEGDKLMYKFEDNGKRKIALRYDQTVPLARVVAQYQNELPLPFKRYQIQNVWRADNTQRGRYREFLQCDADIVGSASPLADAEIIALAVKALEELKFEDIYVNINDRENFEGLDQETIIILDKLKKVGPTEVQRQLKEKGKDPEILTKVKNKGKTKKITELEKYLKDVDKNYSEQRYKFENTLARGLNYYTGIIFEIEIGTYDAGSVAGGGRYDNLIGIFTRKQIPAVGIAFGFDRIMEAMEELKLFPAGLSTTKVLITNTNEKMALDTAETLRQNNINAETFLDEKSLEKQLKYADKKGIPNVIIFEEENLILKDMVRGTQEKLTTDEIVKKLEE